MALIGFWRRLTWKDYPKVQESPNGFDAQTSYSLDVKPPATIPLKSDGTWIIKECTVTIALDRADSWVVAGKETAELLKHEQRHYDLAAIAARDLDNRLKGLKGKGSAQDALNAIFTEVEQTLSTVSERYDEDVDCGTDHGRKKNMQAAWDHRINKASVNKLARITDLNSCTREMQSTGAASGGQ